MAISRDAIHTDLGYFFHSAATNDGEVHSEERAAPGKPIDAQWLPLGRAAAMRAARTKAIPSISVSTSRMTRAWKPMRSSAGSGNISANRPRCYDEGLRHMIIRTAFEKL